MTAASASSTLPPVRHVFIILLENQAYRETIGARFPGSYLAKTLPAQGALLTSYKENGRRVRDKMELLAKSGRPVGGRAYGYIPVLRNKSAGLSISQSRRRSGARMA